MMSFAEKLSFLMYISETSNKELASALSVDPSMVSLMRTGKRKLSKNPAQAKKMAAYFARRCSAPFQRQALSEMLGQVAISPSMPVEALVSRLESWLQGGDGTLADSVLSSIEALTSQNIESTASSPLPVHVPADESRTQFFFGQEGRREVMARVMQECRRMETPGSILIVVDDNLEWLLSDYIMTRKTQAGLLELLDRGFTFHQIVPPMNYINRYAESLRFWLPLYATGKTKAYYYPRLRGNLYRHSIIVVPGCCVQYAAAVGLGSTSEITMFSTDSKLVEAFEKQFQEHVSLCRPALIVHQNDKDSLSCFREFFSCQGSTIQLVNSLSIRSMPRELLERYARESSTSASREMFQTYLDNLPDFEERLSREPYIDMCRLASVEEVLSGAVPVASSDKACCGQPYYTPETYCLHLKNILRLMEQYENFFFLPLHEKEYPDYDLLVNEDGMALVIRTAEPLMTLEVRRQPLVIAFREHLLHRAEAAGYGGIHKEKVRMELRALIQRLNSVSNSK